MLNNQNQLLLSYYQENRFADGYALLEKEICSAEQKFMEELTLGTATDLVGYVLLYCEFAKKEKKPWKAVPWMERVSGAIRFLEDFMADRGVYSQTAQNFADHYAYAGFFPEAIALYEKAALSAQQDEERESALSSFFYYSYRIKKEPSKRQIQSAEDALGKEKVLSLMKNAKKEWEDTLNFDPVELSDSYLSIRYEIERKVDLYLQTQESLVCREKEPFCFRYWNAKKHLLKKDFQIDWKSPAEMNPHIQFGNG